MPTSIRPAPAQRRREAMHRLVSGMASQAIRTRMERLLDSGRLDLRRLFIAVEGDTMVASALGVVSPGRAASIYATSPDDLAPRSVVVPLIEHLVDDLARADVRLAQALLDPSDTPSWQSFRQAGFSHLAHLHTLETTIPRRCTPPTLPDGVTLEHAQDDDVLSILEATYIDTLDCPRLRGLRCAEDILEGHRAGGDIDPSTWLLVRIDDAPVGCLLITGAGRDTADLAYVGLVPDARCRGLGTMLVSTACAQLRTLGTSRLRLAVDAANAPALRVYERAGFKTRSTRRAVIRSLGKVQVGPLDDEMSTQD